jgi:hypothetical protein
VSRLFVAVAMVLSLTAAGATTAQSPASGQTPADGLLRSELSLGGYTTTISFPPALSADDPAHRALLSSPTSSTARVRVGTIEANAGLRIGSIELARPERGNSRYDLWLKGADNAWALEVTQPASTDERPVSIGEIALARTPAATSPNLTIALVPEGGSSARLLLRWGAFAAAGDFAITAPPRSQRVAENSRPNTTVNRSHTEDTSALSRARLLAQRNETAMVQASGERLSVSFQRSFAQGERAAGGGTPRTRGLPADGPDFARLASTPDGAVVMLTEASVPRLRIERPLRFGATQVAVSNQVPNSPGSYGLWLKRAGIGWKLVFNHEPDAWGSQHDPKFDAAEIALQHSDGHAPSRPFAIGLEPTGAERGRLLIIWGPHEWSADFNVVPTR